MDSSFSPYNDTNPSSSSLPSPFTSLSRIWKHHVFPSFYGADVRKTFLSYILESFRRKGIGPFIDGGLETSKSISSELTREIRESKIAVVLFSRNYASSKWCLDELVEIMKCRKELGQTVIPIFYNVDPSDVKKLTGDFGSVFENTCKGKTKGEIKRWRKALEGVATIAGYNSSNWSDEAAMIEEIATNVSNMLNSSTPSRDFDGFVGMRAHMEKMEPLLRLDLDEVKMIGIWGPPGIGKTTIARFLFNQVSDRFQPGPIMVDIKGRYLRPCLDEYSAQLQLQKKMLSQNINHKDIIISHLRGAKEWLKHKKVFLVLDDVDMLTQLDALAKEIGWFGPGSRIIIKTEDPRVLNAHGINHIYKVNFPSSDEAFQIFCMHTFGQKHPYEGFHKLAWEVMALAGNLPLGLKVLGSALRGMSKQEWKRILPNLKTRLDGELESIIKFSYDTLCDEDKYLFLYIACFFNHLITNGLEGVHKVEEILANKFLDVRQGLHVLAERSLISIDEGRIYMHTLLEKFGRETFRKQFVHEVLNDDTIEAEIVQAESKSRRDDNFLGEANSDATCNFENKRVVPVIEEKNLDLSHDFVGHLVKALKKNGVNVDEFPSGDVHFKGIEESRMALVIFSSRYAKSRWCLNELVKIKELMEERKLLVIPIFYKVEPLEVTQLKGDFGVKFWNSWRINRDHHIIEWKEALKSVASMRGINLKEHCSESEFITHTVNKVVYKLPRENPSLFISTGKGKSTDFSKHHPFGMEQRMEQLEKKLEFDCNETLIIGVVGMPGIGKTTLAMRLHEKWNCKFLRCVPLLGIRKKSEEYGLVWLRKTLLEVLLEGKFPAISDKTTHESVKDKLLQKKVFVVLDDVSNKKQLDFLLSDLTWIKKGSKIIITTSDQSLLKGFADDTFVVPLLNDKEAFQLFTYHAFDDQLCSATGNFLSLSRKFVDYARGHPHALISLGIELRGKEEAHWEHRLGIITDRHNTWIQDIWRFSTDQLNEQQKDVFLDIVYFFKSEDEYFVRSLLDSGDPDITDSVSELRDLANKFLITISDGRVEMHNLLYRFSKGLGFPLRHRLWNYEDIINKLRKMELSDAHNVRGIFLDMSKLTKSISLDSSTFMDMRNLRYLKIYDSCCPRQCIADCKLHFPKGLEFPLEEVRYLHWLKFPLKELPKDFRPDNLVDLRLPHSNVERVWEGVKDTPRLKWVDLSHSSNLLDLSALSRAENLQRLNLEGCTILDKLPMEIQYMKSLVFLNLRGCTHLSYLPEMNLVSLKTLILSDCSNLEKFQLISESLEVLHLDGTAIKALPLAIKKLQRLVLLNLKNCEMLECLPKCLGELKALEEIILSGCSRLKNLSDIKENMKHLQSLFIDWIGAKEMPHISCATISEGQASADMVVQPFGPREWPRGVYVVCSLRRLCLSGNDFVSLQTDIGKLYNLNWLDVRQCKLLTSIPMLPPRLQYFDAHGCDSLERVANPLALPVLSEKIHATFNFSNCNKLDQDAKDSILSYTRRKSELVLDALSRHNGGPVLEDFTGSCFPGCEVPAWFSYQASGSLLKQKLPQHWCDNRFTGIALCAVILFPGYYKQRNRLFVKCNCVFNYEDMPYIRFIYTIGSWREPSNTPGKIEPSHVFIGYNSTLDIKKYGKQEDEEGCSQTEASFEFQVTDGTDVLEGCKVLKCGFSLVYATDERENIKWDVETVVIPERIENILGKAISYGDPGSRDDIHYESYSGEAKSDANPILLKSLENKKVDLLNEEEDAGREIINNTSSGNLETLKMHSLVGVELRLKQMEKVLYPTPGKTRIVGVVGMPGSGKTTLAKFLFEKRGCKFPSHLFVTMSKECRLEQLGSVLLKDKLLQSKVFLVLDDVSGKKQLEFLLGILNWIKKGSKIVITTRDKSLLEGLAHDTYVVQQLNNREAFQLFTYHAFYNQMCLSETLLSLSKMFVDNVPGNPLDLKLLGSHLCGKDEAYWQHELRRVRQNFSMKMREVWTFSIDQLNERQRDVFLDIVYFFKSEDENFVKSILDSGNPEAVSEVRDLADKFLITISGGRVEMHDQLYTLGKDLGSPGQHRLCNDKDIINKMTKMKQPEANNVRGIFLDMSEIKESIALECMTFTDMQNLLYLKIYDSYCPRKCKADCNLYFPDGLEFPLEEVRYLHWVKFPLQELPPDFRPKNLVALRLPYSKIERVWEGVKDTPRLKWVDLRHSSKLLDLSALSKAENLQRLNLEGCTSLDELPLEIQNMKSLVFLNLRGCIRLCYLPKMNLISLKTLILSDCSSLKEFQLISESVEFLHLDGTAIEGLPPAIQNLRRLVVLNLKNCKMLECLPNCLGKLKFLDELVLSGCSRLKSLPDVRHNLKHIQILLLDGTRANEMPSISCFTGSEGPASADISLQPFGSYSTVREYACGVNGVSSLRRLCLSGNDFVTLQPDIGKLYNLNWLDVKQCKKLIFVPTLPPRLQYFNAHGCDSLERVANPLALPVLSERNHASFNFSNCNKLDQDAKDSIISYTRWRSQLMLDELTRYDEGSVLEAFTGTCFPGWEVPAWFSHRAFGRVLKPKLPLHLSDNMFTGIALCAVISFDSYHEQRNRILVKCKSVFNNEDGSHISFTCTIGSWSESNNTRGEIESCHVFIGYISMLDIKKLGEEDKERCSHTEALFEFQVTDGTKVLEGCEVLKCGFSLVYATDELQVKSGGRGARLEANHCRAYSKNVAISEVRRETKAAERSPDGGDKATSPQPPIAKYPVSPAEYGTGSNNSGRERHIRMFDVDPQLSGDPQHHNDDLIDMVASSSEAGIRRSHSQVFVSYHGAELHRTFVRHLMSTLTDVGVSVFTGNDKGNGIKKLMQLYQRIEESKIALPIFSKRYVESNICLDELVLMDKLAKEGKLLVIPVFYNVRSSDVRNFKGEFGLRFKEMRERYKDKLEKVLKWKTAMRSIANKIGIDSEVHGEDAHLVEATVEAVQRVLTKISEENPKYLGNVITPTDHVFALFGTFLFCLFMSPLLYVHAYSFPSGVWLVGFLVMVVAVVVFDQKICRWRDQ